MRLYDLIKEETSENIFDYFVQNYGKDKIGIVIYILENMKFAARADKKYFSKYIIRIQAENVVVINRHKYCKKIAGCAKIPITAMDLQDLVMSEIDVKTLEIYNSLFVISKVLSKKVEKYMICSPYACLTI